MTGNESLWFYSCGAGFLLVALSLYSIIRISGDLSRREEEHDYKIRGEL